MKKIAIAFVIGCIVAGGGAWYAFFHLPDRIQGEIDTAIASLAPRVVIEYGSVDIDIFERSAVFSDVTLRESDRGIVGDAKRMVVTTGGPQETFDVLLESASLTVSGNPEDRFSAAHIQLAGLAIRPVSGISPSEKLIFLRRLNLRKITIAKIAGANGKFKVSSAALDDLADASFAKATITGIYGKEKGKIEFSVAEVIAERINVLEMATLPKTFRGQPDWTKLNTGKIAIDRVRLKMPDGLMTVAETRSDGIDAGRVTRFRMAEATMSAVSKAKKPFSVSLGKFEINNFPIISDFPTTLEGLRSFQTQHKNLIYDGFDIRGLKITGAEGSFEIHNATMPKPDFRNTPYGAQYAAKAEMSMDIRGNFGGLKNSGKLPDPIVAKIFKDLKGRVIMTARSSADHEKKTGTLEAMEIAVPGVGRIKLTGNVGNLPLRYYEAPNDPIIQQIALRQATLGGLNLTFVNEGLAEALLETGASQERITVKEFARKLAIMVQAAVAADGSPEGSTIAKEISTFLQDPRSIHLALKPIRPVPILALDDPRLLQSMGRVSRLLGLTLEANRAAR